MKQLYLIVILIFFSININADELVKKTALNGKVSLMVPKSFGPMDKKIMEFKYPMSRRPSEVLSNASGSVSIAFNHTKTLMTQAQVKEAHATMSKGFKNLYPSAKWFRDEVITQNGATFFVLELITPAIDTKIHNIIYGTSVDGKFLLVSFNTVTELTNEWLTIGKEIMSSIKVNN